MNSSYFLRLEKQHARVNTIEQLNTDGSNGSGTI